MMQIEARNGIITDDVLLEKTNELVEALKQRSAELNEKYEGFKMSHGWLAKFKERHNIKR